LFQPRTNRALLVLCAWVLCLAPLFAVAQNEPTAQDLYLQAMQQYAHGDLQTARQTFKTVDAVQLSPDQRTSMAETLRDIDRRLRGAAATSQPTAAVPPAASPSAAEQAQAAAEKLYDQGSEQYGRGDLAAAKQTFKSIDVAQLGWWHRHRVASRLEDIDATLAKQAAAQTALELGTAQDQKGDLAAAKKTLAAVDADDLKPDQAKALAATLKDVDTKLAAQAAAEQAKAAAAEKAQADAAAQAEKLYTQGIDQYDRGDLTAAKQTFKSIDLAQLGWWHRRRVTSRMEDIDAKIAEQAAAAKAQAQAAAQPKTDTAAAAAAKAKADAAEAAEKLYAQGIDQYDRGDLAAAKQTFKSIDVTLLSARHQSRVADRLQNIDAQIADQAAAAKAQAQAAEKAKADADAAAKAEADAAAKAKADAAAAKVKADAADAAEKLYAQGIDQYDRGDLAAAKQTFKSIDVTLLSTRHQSRVADRLQNIDAQIAQQAAAAQAQAQAAEKAKADAAAAEKAKADAAAAAQAKAKADAAAAAKAKADAAAEQARQLALQQADPAWQLTQGDNFSGSGDLAGAAGYYRQVINNAKATDAQKQQAAVKLAAAARTADGPAAQMRRTLDQATEDIQAGRLDEAEAKLKTVRASGVDLGFWDNARMARQADLIRERREQAGQVAAVALPADQTGTPAVKPATPVATPAPVKPAAAGPDVLAEVRQVVVQEKLAEGRDAEAHGDYHAALAAYGQALGYDPNNQPAQAALEAVRAKLAQQAAPPAVLVDVERDMRLRADEAETEYKALMAQATAQAAAGNYAGAVDSVQNAKAVLDRNQKYLDYFSHEHYQTLRKQAETLALQIDSQRVAQAVKEQAQQEQQRKLENQETRDQAMMRTQQEVQRLLHRANELRKEQKYERALEYINQALFLDPTNDAAQAMKEMVEDTLLQAGYTKAMRERNYTMAGQAVDNIQAENFYRELVTYPSDWPALTQKRKAAVGQDTGETEVNTRTAIKLGAPVPVVNFDGNKLANVIEFLRNTTGVNFFVNWAALKDVGVDGDKPINLQLTNVPADKVLRLVLQQAASTDDANPVAFSIVDGIVTISTRKDLNKATATLVYDIRDLLVHVPNFENVPQFDLNNALAKGGSGGTGTSGTAGNGLFGATNAATTGAPEPTRDQMIQQIKDLITSTVGVPADWAPGGTNVSSITEMSGNLIVKTTPGNHRSLLLLLDQLRETRAIQIAVEARFLLVDQNFLNSVGVDFSMILKSNDQGKWPGGVIIGNDSISMAQPQISAVPGNIANNFPNTTVSPSTVFDPWTNGLGIPASSGRSLDVGVTYMDDLMVNLMLHATQADQRAISLSAPRVTFFNGQTAYVNIAKQVAFVSDLTPVADSGGGASPTLSVVQEGVQLKVNGTVSADRRYVTMTLEPALSHIDQLLNIPVALGSTSFASTNVVNIGFIQAPQIEITQVKATVSVPDRGTIMLGGQRLTSDISIEAGVPIISKIPVLNRLFTNKSQTKDERTLLILVRPTIIIQNELEEDLFPGLGTDPSKYPGASRGVRGP
jgi:type II secretory pathway component GspD/PulD (secretin)/outer membrane protein assembly factor BamD (BamD/ComL family)/tetratricopeptide (TPR) repeat protein